MKFSLIRILASLSALFPLALWARPALQPIPGVREFSGQVTARPNQLTGAFRAKTAEREQALKLIRPYIAKEVTATDEFILSVPEGQDDAAFASKLEQSGLFQYVTPNWIVYPAFTPNDPQLTTQWHNYVIDSFYGWDFANGSGITIGICDSGVLTTHQDLAANIVSGYNAASHLAQSLGGDVSDINGHGTHVAGCAAAIMNNGVGIAGPAGGANIMPIRVSNFTSGGAYLSDILEGARWGAEHGAKVMNASFSGVDDPSIETTGEYMRNLNALFFYAAGNDNRELTGFDHPHVIVVGATNSADQKASFSAYGLGVDVFAPGVNIYSTVRSGSYANNSGTSMATPVAAGVAAMIWSANPSLTADDVERILEHSAKDLGDLGEDTFWGWGRVNAGAAVQMARQGKVVYDPATLTFYERIPSITNQPSAAAEGSQRPYYGLTGNLCSIGSATESAFIASQYTGAELDDLWLGGVQDASAPDPSSGWSWLDGTAWSYTNWGTSQPNDSGEPQDALTTFNNSVKWNDVAKSSLLVSGMLVEYPSFPVSISGSIQLGDYVAPQSSQTLSTKLYWNGSLMSVQSILAGNVNISTALRGPLELWVNAPHWLSKRIPITLTSTGFSGLNVVLINGDVNQDNAIDAADFSQLASSFGTMVGDPGFISGADLNGDDEVGPADFAILASNFGAEGDL